MFKDGDLKVDYRSQRVFVGDDEKTLSPIQYRLLECLVQNPDAALIYDRLVRAGWPDDNHTLNERYYVKWHINRIRHKLGQEIGNRIVAIRHVGYRYDRVERSEVSFEGDMEFISIVAEMARSVAGFHDRFNDPPIKSDMNLLDAARFRLNLTTEELGEAAKCVNKFDTTMNITDEFADMLYVAIGSMYKFGSFGLDAMRRVSKKNNEKDLSNYRTKVINDKST